MAETPRLEILIVPASPETKNRNAGLCGLVESAFRQKLGDASVLVASLEDAALRVQQLGRGFVLFFGSALPDECEFERVTAVAHERGLPVAFWTTDDPYEFDAAYKFIDSVDVIFTNDRWTERHYRMQRRRGVHHLPLGASREHHFREVLSSDDDYLYDVFFCGVGFENRQRVIDGLRPILSRVDTLVCGSDWTETAPYVQNRRLVTSELLDAYQHSRIVLNLGREHSYANTRFQITPTTPGPRTFEAAMAGGFQLAFADRPEILRYYALGSEIALFDGLRSATETIGHLLEHPAERIAMCRAAQARTIRDHRYANRVDEVLRHVTPLLRVQPPA